MMATFMLVMVPRAAVCAERITEVLDTESSVVPPADAGRRRSAERASVELRRRVDSATRAPSDPVLRDISLRGPARADHGDHRQHRRGQDDAALPDPAAVRRHRRHGPRRRRRRPRARPGRCCTAGSGWCRRRPYLFTGTVATNLRYGKPDATDDELWDGAARSPRPRTSSRRCRTAWTRRSRRAAPTSPAGSGSGWRSPGRWCARPEIYLFDDSFSALDLATDARLRAALRPLTAGRGRAHRRAAGVHHRRRRPDRRAGGRRRGRPRHATTSCWRPARPTPRSSSPSCRRRRSA